MENYITNLKNSIEQQFGANLKRFWRGLYNSCFNKTLQALFKHRTSLKLKYSSKNVNAFNKVLTNLMQAKVVYKRANSNTKEKFYQNF